MLFDFFLCMVPKLFQERTCSSGLYLLVMVFDFSSRETIALSMLNCVALSCLLSHFCPSCLNDVGLVGVEVLALWMTFFSVLINHNNSNFNIYIPTLMIITKRPSSSLLPRAYQVLVSNVYSSSHHQCKTRCSRVCFHIKS